MRVFDIHGNPVLDPFEIDQATRQPQSCGVGCEQVTLAHDALAIRVRISEAGRSFQAMLPTRWRAGQSPTARRLLDRAQQVMRRLRSLREDELVNSVPGIYALTSTTLRAPDRQQILNAVLNTRHSARPQIEGRSIVIGATEWDSEPGQPWQKQTYGGGLPFRLQSWFTWTSYAEAAQLLGYEGGGETRVAVVALYDPGTSAWWRLWIDVGTHRVLRARLITNGEFSDQHYHDFNRPVTIAPPKNAIR